MMKVQVHFQILNRMRKRSSTVLEEAIESAHNADKITVPNQISQTSRLVSSAYPNYFL